MKIFYFFGFRLCFLLGCNCHFLYLQKEKLDRPISPETPAWRAVRHPRLTPAGSIWRT